MTTIRIGNTIFNIGNILILIGSLGLFGSVLGEFTSFKILTVVLFGLIILIGGFVNKEEIP